MSTPAQICEIIRACLGTDGIEYLEPDAGSFVVSLPGVRRLRTACWLIVTAQGVRVEAFVLRHPDENTAAVHHWLLRRNARSHVISWSIDDTGDIYLTGNLPLLAVTPSEIDRTLGVVLDAADSAFNQLLELGFGSSIRREWAWRQGRGESLANLAPFANYVKRFQQG